MKAYLEADEVWRLEKAATNLRDCLLIRLLSHLGCRVSEALALDVKDVDFDSATVTIRHLKLRTGLACPECGARLGKKHAFCPSCGVKVRDAVAKEQEHCRLRRLPLDKDDLPPENESSLMLDWVLRKGDFKWSGSLTHRSR